MKQHLTEAANAIQEFFANGGGVATNEQLACAVLSVPIPMILHCPKCEEQHIDIPERSLGPGNTERIDWDNPPHRSHLCHLCGHIWRPADVPTTGVKAIETKGENDSPKAFGTVWGKPKYDNNAPDVAVKVTGVAP